MITPSSTKFNKTKRKLDMELKHETRTSKLVSEGLK